MVPTSDLSASARYRAAMAKWFAFKPCFHGAPGDELVVARHAVLRRLNIIAGGMRGAYLFGDHFSVADAYLFVMLRWARNHDIELPPRIAVLFDRISARQAARQSIEKRKAGWWPLEAFAAIDRAAVRRHSAQR